MLKKIAKESICSFESRDIRNRTRPFVGQLDEGVCNLCEWYRARGALPRTKFNYITRLGGAVPVFRSLISAVATWWGIGRYIRLLACLPCLLDVVSAQGLEKIDYAVVWAWIVCRRFVLPCRGRGNLTGSAMRFRVVLAKRELSACKWRHSSSLISVYLPSKLKWCISHCPNYLLFLCHLFDRRMTKNHFSTAIFL